VTGRALRGLVDVAPTLLDLAGLPAGAEGVALGPALRGERPPADRLLYCDVGHEVGVYRSDGFLRVLGTQGAWERDAGAKAPAPIQALPFRWNEDGSWSVHDETPTPADAAAVRRYVGRTVPMHHVAAPTDAERELLRALGYLE
jgi:arylsulfatase A-like enzyme